DRTMRTHGTLIKWNDDRGFGFVSLPQSHEEIFVHVSAFPMDGVRPHIGEIISFEVVTAPDGRKRAEAVQRPNSRKATKNPRTPSAGRRFSPPGSLLAGAAVLALGVAGYNAYSPRSEVLPPLSILPSVETTSPSFQCDGRIHCSEMTSCAEARYF